MMKTIAVTLVLLLLPSCRIFQAGKYERRDLCAKTIPILDEKPSRPYRILRVLEEDSDDTLAWAACKVEADAIVRLGMGTATSSSASMVPIGNTMVAFGGSRSRATLQGLAIHWTAPAQEGELP